jgi:8-oxo-(d)GTP phosphatase
MKRSRRRDDDVDLQRVAGGLVWRRAPDGPKLAVIHRPKRRDWSLPKGRLEDGETFAAAALREVAEETGCRAQLEEFAGYALCEAKRGPKIMMFWHMAVRSTGRFRPSDEVDRLEWLDPGEAIARLDHPVERQIVKSALLSRPRAAARS